MMWTTLWTKFVSFILSLAHDTCITCFLLENSNNWDLLRRNNYLRSTANGSITLRSHVCWRPRCVYNQTFSIVRNKKKIGSLISKTILQGIPKTINNLCLKSPMNLRWISDETHLNPENVLNCLTKPKGMTTQMKALDEYILMVLFVLLLKRVHFLTNET